MEKLRAFWKETSRYLKEVWIEVRPTKGRVAWPSFESIKLATKAVLISSLGLGMFIGILDYFLSTILQGIIKY
ncbi:preprotein translocase subunit SecE [bacterium]|nr:preprotein translocase subunit SecE [bacterium]